MVRGQMSGLAGWHGLWLSIDVLTKSFLSPSGLPDAVRALPALSHSTALLCGNLT
jgi:hypothetical protein